MNTTGGLNVQNEVAGESKAIKLWPTSFMLSNVLVPGRAPAGSSWG
jgi:hypothetical protein